MTEQELVDIAQRAAERAAAQRKRAAEASLLGAKGVLAGVEVKEIQRSPKCPVDWCRYRLMTEREQARGLCDDCAEDKAKRDRRAKQLEKIPPPFQGFSLEKPEPLLAEEKVGAALAWLNGGGRILTIGARRESVVNGKTIADNPTAAGKSTLAAMVAASAVARGINIEWFNAAHLDPVADPKKASETYAAIFAPQNGIVVIDGLGKELSGARKDTDILDRRKGLSAKIPNEIHTSRTKTRFIVTFDLTSEQGAAAYGVAEMRRIGSPQNATVIVLTRASKLEMAGL